MRKLASHETSRLAKELGYHPELNKNEINQRYFTDGTLTKLQTEREHHIEAVQKYKVISVIAPTIFELQEWLMTTQSIWVTVIPLFSVNELFDIQVKLMSWRFPPYDVDYDGWDLYEALESGIVKAMELVKSIQ